MANPDIDISYSEVITTIEQSPVGKITSTAIDEAVAYFDVILAGKDPVQWEIVGNYLDAAFAPMLLEVEKNKEEPITQFVWQYAALEVLGSAFKLFAGDTAISETWNLGAGIMQISRDKYRAGAGSVVIEYKTGTDSATCESVTWCVYNGVSFTSDNYVKIKISRA